MIDVVRPRGYTLNLWKLPTLDKGAYRRGVSMTTTRENCADARDQPSLSASKCSTHTREPPPIKTLKYSNREIFPALILSGNLENIIDAYLSLSFLRIFEIIGKTDFFFFFKIISSILTLFCGNKLTKSSIILKFF